MINKIIFYHKIIIVLLICLLVVLQPRESFGAEKKVAIKKTTLKTVECIYDEYIRIKWCKVSNADGYQIYRATSKDGTYKKVANVKSPRSVYNDKNVKTGKRYYYKVRAYVKVDGKVEYGNFSNIKSKKITLKTTDISSKIHDTDLNPLFKDIPSYHKDEVIRVANKLLDLKKLYPNSIIFGTISDNHVSEKLEENITSAKHAVYALETIGHVMCDFVANFGDNILANNGIDNSANYADEAYIEKLIRDTMTSQVSFNLIGNHDKGDNTQALYNLVGKYNKFDDYGVTKARGYGYKDFTEKKVRVIVLNTTDYWDGMGGNGMSYEQKEFLMKALDLSEKKDFSKWTIIILSHIPLDYLGGDYNKSDDLKKILKAYDDGSTVKIAVNRTYAIAQNEADKFNELLTYNYSGKNAPKVINIHGHIHNNNYGKLKFIDDNTELNMVRVATPNSSFDGNTSVDRYTAYGNYSITKKEALKIAKVANSKADTSATFYLIDLDSQVIHSVGYGADIDRTIPY